MTTWHENESIEDLVEYLRFDTVFDEFVPERFLVLFVGEDEVLKGRILNTGRDLFAEPTVLSPTATNL